MIVVGMARIWFAVVAAPVVAASLHEPAVEPATTTETRTRRPDVAFTTAAAVMLSDEDPENATKQGVWFAEAHPLIVM